MLLAMCSHVKCEHREIMIIGGRLVCLYKEINESRLGWKRLKHLATGTHPHCESNLKVSPCESEVSLDPLSFHSEVASIISNRLERELRLSLIII